jgi:hypothetical protein
MTPATEILARMPDFATGTHAGRHVLDTALACLADLKIPASRIHVRMAGRDAAPDGAILRQSPRPGAPLGSDVTITLETSGCGFVQALPAGMWESGGESEPGTCELLEVFDDPLRKLESWAREGSALFRLAIDNPGACARWLALFGIRAEDWPRDQWYRLAILLADLPRLAGSEEGVRCALDMLFGLPIAGFSWRASLAVVDTALVSRLGAGASRLGVDALVGDAVEDLAHLAIAIGPVALAVYNQYASGPRRELLKRALELLLPAFVDYEISWTVLDAQRIPQLGIAEENSCLGINFYLGSGRPSA